MGTFTTLVVWSDGITDLGGKLSLRLAARGQLASQPLLMQTICEVDVCKKWLDAWIGSVGHQRFANTAEGVGALASWA